MQFCTSVLSSCARVSVSDLRPNETRQTISLVTIPYTDWSPKWLSVSLSLGSKMNVLLLAIITEMWASFHIVCPFILISAVPFINEVPLPISSLGLLSVDLKFDIWCICGLVPSIGEARKFATKLVIFPFTTLRFQSPVKITLKACAILKSNCRKGCFFEKDRRIGIRGWHSHIMHLCQHNCYWGVSYYCHKEYRQQHRCIKYHNSQSIC